MTEHDSMPPVDPRHTPAAPPVTPGELSKSNRTNWHTILGTFGIVYGVLGILSGMYYGFTGVMYLFITDPMMYQPGMNDGVDSEAMAEAFELMGAASLAGGIVSLALGVLMLVAGVGVVRRRTWGVRCMWWWSWCRVLGFVSVGAAYGVAYASMMSAMMEPMQAQGGQAPPAGMAEGMTALMVVFMLLFGAVWYLGEPIFIWVWFTRKRVKEEIAKWGTTGPPGRSDLAGNL